MKYLMALLLPPVAVLMCGKPGAFMLNLFCCCFCWVPGIIHAFMTVVEHNANKRTDRLICSTNYRGWGKSN